MMMTVEFELDGQRFVGINGGPEFQFDEAVSLEIKCETQDDVDYYWERLSDGGEEGQCGWLQGPLRALVAGRPDRDGGAVRRPRPERAQRAMQAMLEMGQARRRRAAARRQGTLPAPK